jgi:hypothetical protein
MEHVIILLKTIPQITLWLPTLDIRIEAGAKAILRRWKMYADHEGLLSILILWWNRDSMLVTIQLSEFVDATTKDHTALH